MIKPMEQTMTDLNRNNKTKATRNNSENTDKDEMLNIQKRENEEGVKTVAMEANNGDH